MRDLVLLSLLLASPAAAQVRLVDAGIVCPRETSGELREAPGTEAGVIRTIDQTTGFDLPDRTVPMLDLLGFGFRTALEPGVPATAVTVVVTHPPMGPRGVERQEWTDTMIPEEDSLNLFTFELEYEKVAGDWAFAIEIDGVPAVSVPFSVSATENLDRVQQACFQFLS